MKVVNFYLLGADCVIDYPRADFVVVTTLSSDIIGLILFNIKVKNEKMYFFNIQQAFIWDKK